MLHTMHHLLLERRNQLSNSPWKKHKSNVRGINFIPNDDRDGNNGANESDWNEGILFSSGIKIKTTIFVCGWPFFLIHYPHLFIFTFVPFFHAITTISRILYLILFIVILRDFMYALKTLKNFFLFSCLFLCGFTIFLISFSLAFCGDF